MFRIPKKATVGNSEDILYEDLVADYNENIGLEDKSCT